MRKFKFGIFKFGIGVTGKCPTGEISVFDIILVIMLGFPSFLLVGGGAKIGISVFDIILVIIHGFPSFLLVGVRGEAGLCPKLELLLQGGQKG